jgi:hypothetical protein
MMAGSVCLGQFVANNVLVGEHKTVGSSVLLEGIIGCVPELDIACALLFCC